MNPVASEGTALVNWNLNGPVFGDLALSNGRSFAIGSLEL